MSFSTGSTSEQAAEGQHGRRSFSTNKEGRRALSWLGEGEREVKGGAVSDMTGVGVLVTDF